MTRVKMTATAVSILAAAMAMIQTATPLAAAGAADDAAKARLDARQKGLEWLAKNQAPDGSWGKQYTVAVTSLACLSHLAASDDPFAGESGRALVKGLEFLIAQQKGGQFPHQGHTWIHGQGFATLALSEAYGRSHFCKTKPDIDARKIRNIVAAAVKVIADNQSTSGGWWYTPGAKGQHEGSTTVTAVQALVSAANHGIEINQDVLDKGFEYLKRCQNADGGFDYQLDDSPNTVSMKEGTAADLATLALMKKFDHAVMMNANKFLIKITPAVISNERFPYYGHFYGCMGMKLLGEEMRTLRQGADDYIAAAYKDVLSWQGRDGAWPLKGWITSSAQETPAYSTAFATLLLSVPEARLSIFNRKPPALPKGER